ncbi:hypothetical protein [Acetomicrobium sp. S15 = DSM 107314]|uniref:hypothetical protein n=1 Tax=Acetomicrobium sp. S15 = DSM 107314 TaxID=2529858 RepID=UPI0018E1A3BA|nr:hypothetical protein [Acetomicrobium sp. S15 = DSM 107314]
MKDSIFWILLVIFLVYFIVYKKNGAKKYVAGKKAEGKKYSYGHYVKAVQTVTTCFIYHSAIPPNEIGIIRYDGVGVVITVNQTNSDSDAYLHAIKIYADENGTQYIETVYNDIVSLYLSYKATPYKKNKTYSKQKKDGQMTFD